VTEANTSAEFVDQRAIDADASAQAAAASEQAVEADRAEVATNTATVADNTAAVVARADEVAANTLQVAADADQVAADAQAVADALASVAGGPVISINGETGVVTLAQVHLDGPGAMYLTQNSQFTVTDFDVFTDYAVQASAGTVSIYRNTISYTAPNVAGPVTLSVFAGDYQRDIVLDILPKLLPTEIGQPFEGGFYAGKIQQADGVYVLIVAPKSTESSLTWKTSNTETAGTASLNDGLANSNAMNNATHPAAQYCRAYNGGGFSDWYLPAKDELEVCYRNLKPDATANNTSSGANTYTAGSPAQTAAAAFKTGGAEAFTVPTWYWTSTEKSSSYTQAQRFGDGMQGANIKASAYLVRPVRRLKI